MLVIVVVGIAGLGIAAVAAGYSGYNGYLSGLPNPAALASMEPPQDTHVYARDGTTLIATFHDDAFRHEHVPLNSVAMVARRATIDVEDRHFYEHASWDFPRIVKAGFDNVTHSGPVQGASTITEQLAKVSFLASADRNIDRKIRQLILGNQIEANFTKDQILEMYLNRIPYGNHAIGIQSASRLYFQKSAADLNLAEATMLAGLPESPSNFNPLIHEPGVLVNPEAKRRQRAVIDAMVSVGDISEPQGEIAFEQDLAFHPWEEAEVHTAPDFVDYLRHQLDTTYGPAYARPGGWEITSTLDLTKQAAAEKALHEGVAAVRERYNAHDGAIVGIDPRNGEVQALVGAWDSGDPGVGQLNMALRPVQPGSTIKVFTYAAAIASKKFTMTTPVVDEPLTLPSGSGEPYAPLNYDRKFHGVCPLKICLGNSFNIPAVKVEAATGIPEITSMEIQAGLTSLRDPDNQPGPRDYAATLGGLKHGISPLDLATGAATLASLGVHHDPTPLLKIVDVASGRHNYVHQGGAGATRAIPEEAAYIINQVTSNDNNRVLEFGQHGALTLPGRRVSAKTGTTEFFVDNWTVGWTPELASAVWVGNPSPSCLKGEDRGRLGQLLQHHVLYPGQKVDDPYSPGDLADYGLAPVNDHCGHLEGATGITGAAPIWNAFMSSALNGTPPTWYSKPAAVLARGAGDDADFYIRGTETAAAPGCIPAGPPEDPTSVCRPPTPPPTLRPLPQPRQPFFPFDPGGGFNPGNNGGNNGGPGNFPGGFPGFPFG
ncbi:MAG: transglycosylase domain-containing protein [Candidatus Dormibacteria bacterium]